MKQTEALDMITKLQLAQQAMEAACERIDQLKAENKALKEALAQPEQEPVALRHSFDGYGYLYTDMGFGSGWIEWTKRSKKDAEPLYPTPPQRKPLTDEEIMNIAKVSCIGISPHEDTLNFAKVIEAVHGIRSKT